MATERSHYEVLSVAPTASAREIRAAYRARARQLHPDVARGTSGSTVRGSVDMADINRAWSVLSDPHRRAAYDLSLTGRGPTTQDEPAARVDSEHAQQFVPARFPWRGMLIVAVIGIGLVLIMDATSSPPAPGRPDQLLQSGSCVRVDDRSEVYEVSCAEPHDGVVRQLVAMDRPCPVGTEPHRDRQGMGRACIDRVAPTGTSDQGVEQTGESG